MIPIICQPEPDGFNENVRIPGNEFLKIHVNDNINIPPYWQKIEKELWNAYEGICSYFSIYFELVDRASSVNHFKPKSQAKELAYEWSNYRLSCIGANRKNILSWYLIRFNLKKILFLSILLMEKFLFLIKKN